MQDMASTSSPTNRTPLVVPTPSDLSEAVQKALRTSPASMSKKTDGALENIVIGESRKLGHALHFASQLARFQLESEARRLRNQTIPSIRKRLAYAHEERGKRYLKVGELGKASKEFGIS